MLRLVKAQPAPLCCLLTIHKLHHSSQPPNIRDDFECAFFRITSPATIEHLFGKFCQVHLPRHVCSLFQPAHERAYSGYARSREEQCYVGPEDAIFGMAETEGASL